MTRAERKKAELRREIIDASFECFAQRGYHATGIADIATTLGIGHGTFYRYFENKRDIIDHVIDDLVAKIISALATENAPDAASTLDEYRAQVGRIAEALPRIFFDDPRIPRVLLFETNGRRRRSDGPDARSTRPVGIVDRGVPPPRSRMRLSARRPRCRTTLRRLSTA